MDNTREAQTASVNARYNEINKKIKNLRGVINAKKSKNEDVSQQETEMEDLINSLKNTVSSLNELRLPAGNTKGDKEPLNFILDLVSSTMEGIMSTSLGPLELLIQLVNFFIELFIGFVKAIIKEIKFFVSMIIEQASKLFPEISTLYSAVSTINTNNKLVQGLWNNLIDLASKASTDVQNIFERFSNLIMKFVNAIISNLKEFIDMLFNEIKKLFPEISTLYDAVHTIEKTSKTNQTLWRSIVDIILSILAAFKTILSGFLNLFLDKFNSLDSSIGIFNESVTKLTELANLNNKVVNETKQRFNGAIDNLKKDLKNLQSNLSGASNKQIGLGQFGSIKGPSFDLTSINTTIDNLNKI
jgi:phage-related protein